MPFRACIVGCGRIGCQFDDNPRRGYVSTHAGAYARTPGVELVALADTDESKLGWCADKFRVPGRYTDYIQMLQREQPDIVSVCTWSYTHLEILRAAVEHGARAVFCEKPIADTLAAADEMIRLCADRGVILVVDHQRRFDPMHQSIAKLVRGPLGRIQQVTCYYTAGVANTGSHLIDLLRFFLGDLAWVQGRYARPEAVEAEDPDIDGWIGFEKGVVAAVQSCDVQAYNIFEVTVLGTKGRVRLLSSGFEAEFEEARPSERFAGYKELRPAAAPFEVGGAGEFMLHGVAHLVECLQTGRPPICGGEDGRAALEGVCALRESARREGERVVLPLRDTAIVIQ